MRAIGCAAFAVMLAASASAAQASELSCSNRSAEIRCDDGSCVVESDAFTPMFLTISGESVELCAYSTCMEGTVVSRYVRPDWQFIHAVVGDAPPGEEQPTGPATTDLAVIYNSTTRTAQLTFGGFANVMDCDLAEPERG